MIEVVLNTGSTVTQGAVIKGGRKNTEEYVREAAYCDLNPEDMKRLGSPEKVKVSTEVGEVTVYARSADGVFEGEAFIPRGPWANTIISADTQGTGSPYYKGMKAWIEPSTEEVLDTVTLIKTYYLSGR
jgi:formylmethanofuran dehydrogenase subunit D